MKDGLDNRFRNVIIGVFTLTMETDPDNCYKKEILYHLKYKMLNSNAAVISERNRFLFFFSILFVHTVTTE